MSYEFHEALARWKMARANFYHAEEGYVEVAINELNAAQEHLDAVVQREKILKAEAEEKTENETTNIPDESRCKNICSLLASYWAQLSALVLDFLSAVFSR